MDKKKNAAVLFGDLFFPHPPAFMIFQCIIYGFVISSVCRGETKESKRRLKASCALPSLQRSIGKWCSKAELCGHRMIFWVGHIGLCTSRKQRRVHPVVLCLMQTLRFRHLDLLTGIVGYESRGSIRWELYSSIGMWTGKCRIINGKSSGTWNATSQYNWRCTVSGIGRR